MQSHLLVCAREGPRDLEPAFLTEYEPHLAGRPEALGMIGAIGCTWSRVGYGTQKIATEEAVLTGCLSRPAASVCHDFPVPFHSKLNFVVAHQSELHRTFAIRFSGKRRKFVFSVNRCKQRDICVADAEPAAFSAAFKLEPRG
jgi:hypothetical protein